jgi:hypothetical protein
MKKLLLAIMTVGVTTVGFAQPLSLTSTSQVLSENFDGLSASGTAQTILPNGWWIQETGSSGNTTYRAGDGNGTTGDTYSFGAVGSSERALGSLASNGLQSAFGVRIINNSGNTLTQFSYDLFMEQWRGGGRTGLDSLYFSYSVNNGVTGAWTRVTTNDLVSKVTIGGTTGAALDGNAAANRQFYSFIVSGLTWPAGDTLTLRWNDPNVGGNDDGLAIDNFNFTIAGTLPVQFKSFTATKNNDAVNLKWATATESNNKGFEVQRSVNGAKYQTLGFVKGNGNSNVVKTYSFTDAHNTTGNICYRLKQIDFNGASEFSKVACVNVELEKTTAVVTTPNPFNGSLHIKYISATEGTANVQIIDMLGKSHQNTNMVVNKGENTLTLDTDALPVGIYFIRVTNGAEVTTQRIVKK